MRGSNERMEAASRSTAYVGIGLVLLCLLWPSPTPAMAQTEGDRGAHALIEQYQQAIVQERMRRFLEETKDGFPGRPARLLPTALDTLGPWLAARTPGVTHEEEPDGPAPLVVEDVRHVRHFAYAWFEQTYGNNSWAYLGSVGSHKRARLDTTQTPQLRARLQAHFGDPTVTMAELGHQQATGEPSPQFVYALVINDSMAVQIRDVNGPEDRGLILMTESRWRDRLLELRAALLKPLLDIDPAPYVDYYYNREFNHWQRTGYDGSAYFIDRIRPPNLRRGRPQL